MPNKQGKGAKKYVRRILGHPPLPPLPPFSLPLASSYARNRNARRRTICDSSEREIFLHFDGGGWSRLPCENALQALCSVELTDLTSARPPTGPRPANGEAEGGRRQSCITATRRGWVLQLEWTVNHQSHRTLSLKRPPASHAHSSRRGDVSDGPTAPSTPGGFRGVPFLPKV